MNISNLETQILLVEDNPEDALFLREQLGEIKTSKIRNQKFKLIHKPTCKDALEFLQNKQNVVKPDIILLDLNLPDGHNMGTIDQFKMYIDQIPILILTGMNDEDIAIKAIQMGIQDYYMKDQITPEFFTRTVNYAIERFKTIHALHESEERYRIMFNGVSDAIIIIEKDEQNNYTKIHEFNETASQFFGYQNELIQQVKLSDIFEVSNHNLMHDKILKTLNEKRLIFELMALTREKKSIPVEINANVFRMHDQEYLLWMIRDISSRKKVETAIQFDHDLMDLLDNFTKFEKTKSGENI
jgi:PAS domain S-box-containing protein